MKIGRAFGDPCDEFGEPRVGPERLYRVILARQFRFRQRRVDLIVANLMQQDHGSAFPTFQLGHQMVQALLGLRRNRAVTKRANRVIHLFVLSFAAREGKKNRRTV